MWSLQLWLPKSLEPGQRESIESRRPRGLPSKTLISLMNCDDPELNSSTVVLAHSELRLSVVEIMKYSILVPLIMASGSVALSKAIHLDEM